MSIAIYSGSIPSTTFVERLIITLAEEGFQVILFGKVVRTITYKQPSIKLVSNKDGLFGLIQYAGRLLMILLLHPKRYFSLKNYLGYSPISGKYEFRKWQRYLPLLLNLPDIFHLQWARTAEEWLFLKKLFGVKLVLSLRGTQINVAPLADVTLAESYRRSFNQYDAIHVVSKALLKEAVKYGADESKLEVIYSGLPYRALPDLNKVSSEKIRILSVGRFHWTKGYLYLLDALKNLKNQNVPFNLTLIAEGEFPEELLFQIHDLDLTREINWINGLPHDAVQEQMLNHDVLVLSSVEEGIANVVLEAMQLGLLVVSTNCGGMSEVIEDEQNGFLVPVRNPKVLADTILKVWKLPLEDRNRIRLNANKTIIKKFNLTEGIKKIIALYQRISEPKLDIA